jgi:C4-dicarboxylate-specific signal transduction histidine kinase
MVVMFVSMTEVLLSVFPNPVRYSVGWYAGRVCGLLSGSLILFVLLHEITKVYARLIGAIRGQSRERDARLITGDAVAAAIAHEVKQPLSGMITSADAGLRFLNRSIPDFDEAKDAFKQIVADGHRAAAVIGGIRALFKQESRSRVSLDLNKLIHATLALTEESLEKHRIQVIVKLDEQLPQVAGDQIQLQQVLVNLITNAIESMAATDVPRALSVKSEIHDNRDVTISVADSGTGIGPQDIDQIFNPLYTTKSNGMGMGLSICRSIIEAHDGRLWVLSNAPRGAVFCFSLARSAAA